VVGIVEADEDRRRVVMRPWIRWVVDQSEVGLRVWMGVDDELTGSGVALPELAERNPLVESDEVEELLDR
jgi:hypothetical protein